MQLKAELCQTAVVTAGRKRVPTLAAPRPACRRPPPDVCCGCAVPQDVLLGLVGVYNTTKTENVKATTASTLSRLLRSNPELLPVLLDSCGGPQTILKGACLGALAQQDLTLCVAEEPSLPCALACN